jgi:eukaryotic-like serine/threonine-protein kinase
MKAIGDVGAGHTLGRYELLAPIARGGMAVVWAARMKGSRGFQKLVAIKSMLPSLTDDDGTFEEMFLAEAQLAAQIRHPHVAEVLDLGEQDGVLFIVMEWVDGEPLGTIHKVSREQNVQVPIAITTRVGLNVAQALHAAHELKSQVTGETYGLVHRDVSPQNILITFDGVVKVVDFGVAKATHAAHGGKTAVGQMKGKVTYMAPEQARGEPIDRRADIFALGIVLYQLVTNRHPFKGETPLKTLDKILDAKPVVPPITYTPTCHPALNAAIVRALEKDKRKRYASMAEMAEVLETALSKMISRGGDLAPWVRGLVGDRGEMRRETIRDALRIADDRKDRATVPQLQQALAAAAPKGSAEDRSETPGASSISTPGETSAPGEPSAPLPVAKPAPPAPPAPPPLLAKTEPLPIGFAKTEQLQIATLPPPPEPPRPPPPPHKRPPAATLDDPSLAQIPIGASALPDTEAPAPAKEEAVAAKEPVSIEPVAKEVKPVVAKDATPAKIEPPRTAPSDRPVERSSLRAPRSASERPSGAGERRSAMPAVVAVKRRKKSRAWLAFVVLLLLGGGIAVAAFTFPGALDRFTPLRGQVPPAPALRPSVAPDNAPAPPPVSASASASAAASAAPSAAPTASAEPEAEVPSAAPSASASAKPRPAPGRTWRRPIQIQTEPPPPLPPAPPTPFVPQDL